MKVLEKIQFGDIFSAWVMRLYLKQEAEFFMEVFTSENISLNIGVHQGCPLSPLLFNLVIEVLAEWIRQNIRIKDIETSIHMQKLLLYVDDVVFTWQNPLDSL